MSFWRRPFTSGNVTTEDRPVQAADQVDVSNGSLQYVAERAENNSGTTYQEAAGAPVEVKSPLGYTVGPLTIMFLNVSTMIGTGVSSIRKFATVLTPQELAEKSTR
jgi:hypothetical protein